MCLCCDRVAVPHGNALPTPLSALQPCEVNSFTPVSGLFGCIKCPIGFAAAAAGSTKCEYKGFSS